MDMTSMTVQWMKQIGICTEPKPLFVNISCILILSVDQSLFCNYVYERCNI